MNILHLWRNVNLLHHSIPDLQNTVTFSAFATRSINIGFGYATLIFDRVTINEGQGYSGRTGVFTCPISGFYVFTWTLQTIANKSLNSYIVKNGGNKSTRFCDIDAKTSSRASASNTEVMHLTKGDRVYIQGGGYLSSHDYVSSFNGWKIN